MLSVKGHYKDGVVIPAEPISGQPECEVIVTFPKTDDQDSEMPVTPDGGSRQAVIEDEAEDRPRPPVMPTDYDRLTKIINEHQMDTGITDLAHQHDYYLYGTPKRESCPSEAST